MTRGDEDIEGGGPKIFRHLKRVSEKNRGGGGVKNLYTSKQERGAPKKLNC